MKKWTLVIIILLLIWNLFLSFYFFFERQSDKDIPKINVMHGINSEKADVTKLTNQVHSAIVQVHVTGAFGNKRASGFIVEQAKNSLKIVTVASVLEDNEKISVTFDSGAMVEAELIDKSKEANVALLKVNVPFQVIPLQLAKEKSYQLGKMVIALGARQIMSGSACISRGVMSNRLQYSLSVKDSWRMNIIQSDTMVQKDMYGGVILDGTGTILGMIIDPPYGQSANFSYAIASFELAEIINQLGQKKALHRGNLGLIVRNVAELYSYEKSFRNLKLDNNKGVLVMASSDNSEFLAGDVITKIDKTKIDTITDYIKFAYQHQSGDKVTVTLERDGQEMTLAVKMK